jgi:hypothetical protein
MPAQSLSRHAALKGLDPPELAAISPVARRLSEAVKALKRSVPLQFHSDISTIKTRFCVTTKVTKTDPKRSFSLFSLHHVTAFFALLWHCVFVLRWHKLPLDFCG